MFVLNTIPMKYYFIKNSLTLSFSCRFHGGCWREIETFFTWEHASHHSSSSGYLGEKWPGTAHWTDIIWLLCNTKLFSVRLCVWYVILQVLDVSGASVLAEAVPGCQVHLLDNCGHTVVMERPRKSAQLIMDFIIAQQNTGNSTKKLS